MDEHQKVDHLKHLRELSQQLISCKDNIETNWRLQVLFLALAAAVVLGLDAEVMELQFIKTQKLDPLTLQIASRLIVSLLIFYSFFQFGILLGEYRETKRAASIAKSFVASESNKAASSVKGGQAEPDLHKEAEHQYINNLDSTFTQFEFFFRESKDFRMWGVVGYLVLMNSIMHGLGAFLVFDVAWNLYPSWMSIGFFLLLAVYAVGLSALYIGHHKRIQGIESTVELEARLQDGPLNKDALADRASKVGWITVIGAIFVFSILAYFDMDKVSSRLDTDETSSAHVQSSSRNGG